MKNSFFKLGITIFLISFIFSCSDSNGPSINNNGLAESPEALTQFDNSNFGIYKGVFVGSSGIIVINVNNDNLTISATLVIDGITFLFTTTDIIQENQDISINFINGNNSFTFSVFADGTNPFISNLSILGHPNANITLVKEISSSLIELFEGSYVGVNDSQEAGTFNAIVGGNEMVVLAYSTSYEVFYTAEGTIDDSTIDGVTSTGTNFTGTIDSNEMSGNWNNSQSNENGNWYCSRTY
tara:strand:+ start:1844 stop:2563 length:720 start_codon:yes stop_codon:yes gene_type:complete